MLLRLKEADLHITNTCSARCPYCYVDMKHEGTEGTPFQSCEMEGDLEQLMRIVSALRHVAGVEDLVLVGGDPCRHSNLVPLLRHAKAEHLNTIILSNTHIYREDGHEVEIEEVADLIDEMDFTLHGADAVSHDAFNNAPGSYDTAISRIKRFMKVRSEDQGVGIILNMVPPIVGNAARLYEIMHNIVRELDMKPDQDFFAIQRIAPSGKALMDWESWKLDRIMLNASFDIFDEIKEEFGIETRLCIDAFPWCAVQEKHRHYLEPLRGGCNWGRPDGVMSVLLDGTLQRCALCHETLSVNILDVPNREAFSELLENHPMLRAVREHRHLAKTCLQCKLLEQCGGGCVIANTDGVRIGDPYKGTSTPPQKGVDYLKKESLG